MTTSSSQTTALTMLHYRTHNPVNLRIVTNGIVARIHKNHLIILVSSILVHPVAVQYTQVLAHTTHTTLSNRTKVTVVLQTNNTLVLGLSIHNTLRIRSFTSSTTNSNTIHNITLLRLHSQTTSLVGTGRMSHTADLGELTILPRTNTKHITHSITLLLSPQLFQVLVGTHVESIG